MKPVSVYITARDKAQARAIGKALVEERLVACVNIIGDIQSMYRWEGKIVDDTEALIIAKTRKKLFPALVDKVKSLHTYECPCIVCWPILDGYGPFLDWIATETRGDRHTESGTKKRMKGS